MRSSYQRPKLYLHFFPYEYVNPMIEKALILLLAGVVARSDTAERVFSQKKEGMEWFILSGRNGCFIAAVIG